MRCAKFRRIAILLSTLIYSQCSDVLADKIPGFGSAPYYYYSTDRSPVSVIFARLFFDGTNGTYKIGHTNPETGEFIEGDPILKTSMSRAYIYMISLYTSEKKSVPHPYFFKDAVPDSIVSSGILRLSMTYPNGLPYSIVYDTWPRHKPDMTLPGVGRNVSGMAGKDEQIRALVLRADIVVADGSDVRNSMLYVPDYPKGTSTLLGTFDGFKRYKPKGGGTVEEYYDDGPDEIRLVNCYRSPEQAHPNAFCTYSFPLNSKVMVRLHFLDFRIHGGRAFARERIRVFKNTMCPILNCDERALSAAEIAGE